MINVIVRNCVSLSFNMFAFFKLYVKRDYGLSKVYVDRNDSDRLQTAFDQMENRFHNVLRDFASDGWLIIFRTGGKCISYSAKVAFVDDVWLGYDDGLGLISIIAWLQIGYGKWNGELWEESRIEGFFRGLREVGGSNEFEVHLRETLKEQKWRSST